MMKIRLAAVLLFLLPFFNLESKLGAYSAPLGAKMGIEAPEFRSIMMSNGVEVEASHLKIEEGYFFGRLTAHNKSSRPQLVSVWIMDGKNKSYLKQVLVPQGKSVDFDVFPPIIKAESWHHYSVFIGSGKDDNMLWTSFSKYASGRTAPPKFVAPSDTRILSEKLLFYFQIPTLSLSSEQWSALNKLQKESILEWLTIGGNLNFSVSDENAPHLKAELGEPFLNLDGGNYGAGRLSFNERLDWGQENPMTRFSSSNFQVRPSWQIHKPDSKIFIPAIVIFTILIGPGALYWAHRRKKHIYLLIFIPAISVMACVGLFLIALFQDGVTPKICPQSITFLNQSSGKALTQEIVGIEAPLGLFSPILLPENALVLCASKEDGKCVVKNGGIELSGFVLPRIPFFFSMQKIEKRRERLDVFNEGGRIKATNGLKSKISKLILRDEGGEYWELDSGLAPGLTADLRKCTARPDNLAQFNNFNPDFIVNGSRLNGDLAKGTYQLFLESNVFGDNGIDSKRLVGSHYSLLIGEWQ